MMEKVSGYGHYMLGKMKEDAMCSKGDASEFIPRVERLGLGAYL
jgi:hypothetical protein